MHLPPYGLQVYQCLVENIDVINDDFLSTDRNGGIDYGLNPLTFNVHGYMWTYAGVSDLNDPVPRAPPERTERGHQDAQSGREQKMKHLFYFINLNWLIWECFIF